MKKSSILFLLLAFCINASFAQSVGTTEGVFNVSDMGAANYTIPIKVPDGINGMQPNLAISYSSQGGDGPLGMGWAISGLSAITRTGNTIYHDNKVNGISLSNSDKFALDGNRLMVTGSTYGASASKYRTEIETFKDITANGTLGTGPQSFTVTDQNGWTYEYGNTSDSRQVPVGKTEAVAWYLNKVTDLNGNYMTFQYSNVDGEVLPKYIKYNSNQNTGLTYQTYVWFSYTTGTTPNVTYLAGGSIKSIKRINKIGVIQKVNTVWKYYRSYIPEYTDDFYTHLTKVTEKGAEEIEVLNPTEFTYGLASQTDIHNSRSELQTNLEARSFAVGDYNADGLSDLIDFSTSNSGDYKLFLRNQSSGFTQISSGVFENGYGTYASENQIKKDPTTLIHFDYNGDGKSDFARLQNYNPNTVSQQRYWVYISDGSSISNIGTIVKTGASGATNPYLFANTVPFTGDFDGDGKSEILLLNTWKSPSNWTGPTPGPNNYLIGEKYCTSVTTYGYSAFKPKELGNFGFDASYIAERQSKLLVVDYDGDGKQEILSIWHDNSANADHAQIFKLNVTFDASNSPVIGSPAFINISSGNFPTLKHEVFPGDFNGDRITDVLTYKDTDGWKIGYGKGDGIFSSTQQAPQLYLAGFSGGYYVNNDEEGPRALVIADYNGDGKDDIFDYSFDPFSTPVNPKIFYSKGDNTFSAETLTTNRDLVGIRRKSYFLGDYNGDGQVDLITKNEINNNALPYEISFHPNETRHLLSKVKNGLGSETKIHYLPLTNNSVYNNQTVSSYTYPYIKSTIPFKVVSNINSDNGINSAGNNTTYSYRGLKYHVQGKGLLGFDHVKSYDASTRMSSEKSFELNTTYVYPYLKTTYSKYYWPAGTEEVLSTQTNTYGVYHYGNKRIFPYQISSQQINALTGEITSVTNNYVFPSGGVIPQGVVYSKDIGKPFSITTNKGNGLEVSTQTFYYPNSSTFTSGGTTYTPAWVYSKPSKIVTSNTRQGQSSYSRTATFTYSNTTGQLFKTVSDPNTSNEVSRWFFYNSYGNPTTNNTYGNSLLKQEEMEYDPSNRYVTKSYFVSHPAIQNNATYDAVSGNKLTETSPDGFTTTYTYDGFGRIKTSSDNNGLTTTISYVWGSMPPGENFPFGGSYYIGSVANTGAATYTIYDRLGREIKSKSKTFQNEWRSTIKSYNNLGQAVSISKLFTGPTWQNINTSYDAYGRKIQISAPEGNTTYTYSPAASNNYTASITNPAGQTTKVTTDASGAKVSTTDAQNNALGYTYHSNGRVKSVTNGSTTLQTYTYDAYNNLAERWDPNYGTYKYTYDAYGQMLSQTDPKNQAYTYKYDGLGRMYQKTGPEGNYNYAFENNAGTNCGKMTRLTGPEGKISYDYGTGDKINTVTYDDNGLANGLTGLSYYGNISYSYNYNAYGMVASKVYSTGQGSIYDYVNGELTAINDIPTSTIFYQKQSENAAGQVTAYSQSGGYSGNTLTTENTYNSYNLLTGQKSNSSNASAGTIRNITYNFDPTTGNLLSRKDNKYGLTETFSYDNLNRLTGITNSNSSALNIGLQYTTSGNIEEKTDAGGSFEYDPANRISTVNLNTAQPQNIPYVTQELSYTPFDKVKTIKEGNYQTEFHYWPDGSRSMMVTTNILTGIQTYKMYAPDMEMEYNPSAGQERLNTYVNGPDGNTVAIQTIDNAGLANYFVLTDHLGSFTQIVNEWGNIEEEKSFDAWGRLRNPQTWEPYASNINAGQPQQLFDRGYTGHEHLPYYGIINMNGRLYDPVMGRMFSPDVNINGTDDLQGYNRYTYAANNPLIYNDPDGNIWHIIIGAAIGGVINLGIKAYQGKIHSFGDGVAAFGIGAIAGGLAAGTGGAIFTAAGGGALGVGGFSAGAWSAGSAGMVNYTVQGIGNTAYFGDPPPTAEGVAINTLIGAGTGGLMNGIPALMNGRNFWNGNLLRNNPSLTPLQGAQPGLSLDYSPKVARGQLNNNLSINAETNIKSAEAYDAILDYAKSSGVEFSYGTRETSKGIIQWIKLDGTTYQFRGWSSGGLPTMDIINKSIQKEALWKIRFPQQ